MKKYILFLVFCISTLTSLAQSYEELIVFGMDYVDKKDYPAAAESFKAALRKEPANPGNIMLMVNLASIERRMGSFDEALLLYNVALTKHPNTPFILHSRASLYCEMNRLDDALKDYNAILLKNDQDEEALYRRALVYMAKKEVFSAEEDFEKIVKLFPNNMGAKLGIGLVQKQRKEWKEAEQYYSDLIFQYRNYAQIYFDRAECYLAQNRLARAKEDIDKAVSLGYTDPAVHIMRGRLYLTQYDKKQAKDCFSKAREEGADEALVSEFLELCK